MGAAEYDQHIHRLSRRAALGLALPAVAALAGCDGDDGDLQDTTQTISPERKRGDAAVVASLLDLERTAVVAYETARPRLGELAARFLAHERAHARALERALRELGASPDAPRPRSAYSSDFPPLRTREDALRFALDVEQTQIAAYGDGVPALFTPELRVTVTTIFAAQAEHTAVVLGELGEPQAPRDFLVGEPPE
ncbi:MAG: ferritin-like domain-containing protein [Actinomycetota bacterium]|nr:ferritin-like domain-containing protein [Actinomycetota bacterium]